jgi:saccharopine dehydrogenase (NADP+, L-glutamate forming)
VLAALRSPARYIEGGEIRTAVRPWEATRPLVLGGEAFEVYPNRDSLPFVAQYAVPPGWRLATFVRGTLRNAGWYTAWSEVFDTVRAGDEDRIRALAAELADRYPTTAADRDRVVLTVELTVRDSDGATRWHEARLLDVSGDAAESAMARCVSLPLARGVVGILDGALPAGVNRAAESADEAARWIDFLAEHGLRMT